MPKIPKPEPTPPEDPKEQWGRFEASTPGEPYATWRVGALSFDTDSMLMTVWVAEADLVTSDGSGSGVYTQWLGYRSDGRLQVADGEFEHPEVVFDLPTLQGVPPELWAEAGPTLATVFELAYLGLMADASMTWRKLWDEEGHAYPIEWLNDFARQAVVALYGVGLAQWRSDPDYYPHPREFGPPPPGWPEQEDGS